MRRRKSAISQYAAVENITAHEIEVFTQIGREKGNLFLVEGSRDFRDFFAYLWGMWLNEPSCYTADFRKVLEQSKSFGRFVLAGAVQNLMKSRIPFDEFYPALIKVCYQNYQNNEEAGARGWVIGTFQALIIIYPQQRAFLQKYIDSLDITENIRSDRTIYVDEHLALTFKAGKKGSGELLFGARNAEGLWSFDKSDMRVPAKSLRQAKAAVQRFAGKPRKGELRGNDAPRFCRFLGLEVREDYAYMPRCSDLQTVSPRPAIKEILSQD